MNRVRGQLGQIWADSRAFRIILILALVYVVLRLAIHGAYLAMMLYPNSGVMGGMPEWTGAEGEPMVPNDLQDYLDGSAHLWNQQDLYLEGELDRVEFFQYAPAYALAFTPFLWMSPLLVTTVHSLLHIGAYALLYYRWSQIFQQLGLDRGTEMMARTLPVWLVFSAFWADIGYLNIYIIMALLSTLLTEAVLHKRLGWSLLWLSVILQTKPQWAFAVILPLLLGQYQFFLKLLGGAALVYLAVTGTTIAAVGPAYGVQQYKDYFRFLVNMPANFPWRGANADFLGYNHSIKQTVVYALGESRTAFRLATTIKLLLLAPLAAVSGRYITGIRRSSRVDRRLAALDLAFAFYLGAFIWLDIVWELSLGIVVFIYLLATVEQRILKGFVWALFLPYAAVDLWQLVSFIAFGMDVVAPGPYILTDPSIYVPITMITILAFYALLIRRLWSSSSKGWEASIC